MYLLLHPEGRTKEQAGLAFWPDASRSQLRNNFHVTLHRLRRALGGSERVVLEGERYVIGGAVNFDALRFERDASAARRLLEREGSKEAASDLERALELWGGDLLEGEPVGDWHLEHRDHLRRVYREALEALAIHHETGGRAARAAELYRRLLRSDNLDERALRRLLNALVAAGDRSGALLEYRRFADRLRRELGGPCERETQRLAEALLREAPGGGPGAGREGFPA